MTADHSGLLVWGQPGTYDAPDDRMVITALSLGRQGLVAPCVLSAGSGLTVNIAPGWWAVAPCDDGTMCIIGSRHPLTVQAVPGPATGSREDYIWADTRPDDAEWELSVIPAAAAAGRFGLRIASIFTAAGNNLASQMTLQGARVDFGHLPGLTLSAGGLTDVWMNATQSGLLYVYSPLTGMGGSASLSRADSASYGPHTGTNYGVLSRSWRINAGDAMDATRYRFSYWGQGNPGTAADAAWNFAIGGLPSGPTCNFRPAGGGFTANNWFHWWARIEIQINGNSEQTCRPVIYGGAQAQAGNYAQVQGIAHGGTTVPFNRGQDYDIYLAASWAAAATGRTITSYSSAFERLGGGGFVPQPQQIAGPLGLPAGNGQRAVPVRELTPMPGSE